jgi:hypothetical protein
VGDVDWINVTYNKIYDSIKVEAFNDQVSDYQL